MFSKGYSTWGNTFAQLVALVLIGFTIFLSHSAIAVPLNEELNLLLFARNLSILEPRVVVPTTNEIASHFALRPSSICCIIQLLKAYSLSDLVVPIPQFALESFLEE